MLADLGLAVTRHIPIETLAGLLSGVYSVHGGVIRDGAGRIIAHLATPEGLGSLTSFIPGVSTISGLIANGQLMSIGRDIGQIQQTVDSILSISMAGTALAGLGLVASVAGFAYMHKRFGDVEKKLDSITKSVKDVKRLLTVFQMATLKGAVDNMRHAEKSLDAETRRGMLLQAKRDFTNLSHQYEELWLRCSSAEEARLMEDAFTLSFTGSALCLSELQMAEVAANDFTNHLERWRKIARSQVCEHLLSDNPVRLLGDDCVETLPSRELVALMDFATGQKRGIDWLDQLRLNKLDLSSSFKRPSAGLTSKLDIWRRDVDKSAISMGRAFLHKDKVLDATREHMNYLHAKRLSGTQFTRSLHMAVKNAGETTACVSLTS